MYDVFAMNQNDKEMLKEELLGRSLVKLYGLHVEPYILEDGRVYSWKAYAPDIGPHMFFYEFRTWKELLFGISGKESLNNYVSGLNIVFKDVFHANVLDFNSLDELDILMTLAGRSVVTAH